MNKLPTGRRTRTAPPRQERQIRRIVLLDKLGGSTVPMVAGGIAILAWPLSVAGLIATTPALVLSGAASLVLLLHVGLADFVDERTSRATAATLVAFAALWAFVVFEPFSAKLGHGPEVFAGDLTLDAAPVAVSLGGRAGNYDLVVEGKLGSGLDHASRSARYRIDVASDGAPAQRLSGEFTDRWSERRSGRRGVSAVHVSHTERAHVVRSASGGDLQLSLESLSPGAHDAVGVHLYRDTFPAPLFVALGTAVTVAAIVIDGWRFTDPRELLLTTITLGALIAVASFRRFAPPHPGFGDLAFNGAVGAVTGTVAGRVLVHGGRFLRGRR